MNEDAYSQSMLGRALREVPASLERREAALIEKLASSKKNSLNKLAQIYEFTDAFNQFVDSYTPCKKGCSSCCHYPVSVTRIEIDYIERETGHRRLKKPHEHADFMGTSCSFLKRGSCSIYAARPFACRMHHVLYSNAALCEPEVSLDREGPKINSSNLNQAYFNLRIESGSHDVMDIRQVFAKSGIE